MVIDNALGNLVNSAWKNPFSGSGGWLLVG
jgi:hypothetical protein